ncbi:MAG TPA: hypothetical protein VFX61_16630 [Micromonosporaceae bacterium]|nr:hypothetical protein [Micromonosporaceae bacterium]
MEIAELRRALDDVFDQAVVYHAYTNYMRDYEVIVYATADPRTDIQPAHLRYLFKHCVQAEASTALSPDIWRESLDERLTDPEIGPDLDGYVWAVRWQPLYPGAQLVAGGPVPGTPACCSSTPLSGRSLPGCCSGWSTV